MEKGMKHQHTITVTDDMLASHVKSGTLDVYATPMMVALVEQTCTECIQSQLAPGLTTVGTHIDIKHLAPTPVGMAVTCECELTAIDGRMLTFHATVSDACGIVGEGFHERFIVDVTKFQNKAAQKASQKKPLNH